MLFYITFRLHGGDLNFGTKPIFGHCKLALGLRCMGVCVHRCGCACVCTSLFFQCVDLIFGTKLLIGHGMIEQNCYCSSGRCTGGVGGWGGGGGYLIVKNKNVKNYGICSDPLNLFLNGKNSS